MVCIDAPLINQMKEWPTGCESVSAGMAPQALGKKNGPGEFIEHYLPRRDLSFLGPVLYGPDPQQYFIGDDFWSYACYAGAILKALRSYCREKPDFSWEPVDCTGAPPDELFALLDQGIPVIFWATMFMEPSEARRTWKLEEDLSLSTHCLAGHPQAVGYDRELVFLRHREKADMAVSFRKRVQN